MNNNQVTTMDNFVGVDFHVHTPASNCYKGTNNSLEYINIIKKYVEMSIKVYKR